MFKVNSQKIRAEMFRQHLNITSLSKKAALQGATVSRLMVDGAKSNSGTIGKIADALSIHGEELILKE